MSWLYSLEASWLYVGLVAFIGVQVGLITLQTLWLVLRTTHEQHVEQQYQRCAVRLHTHFITALRSDEGREAWLAIARKQRLSHVRRFLLEYLQRTEGEFREKVARLYRELGLLDDDRDSLQSRDWLKRMRTLRVLLYVARDEELDLLQSLSITRLTERLAICFVFARLGRIDLLLEQLCAVRLHQRHASQPISAMLWSMSPDSIHALMQRWTEIPDPFLRRALLMTSATAAPASCLEVLQKASVDPALEIRIGACQAACRMSAPPVRAMLLHLLEDETWEVRGQAAKALGVLRDRCAIDALCTSMGDRSFWVRQNSAAALGRMGAYGMARLEHIVQTSEDRYAVDAARQVLTTVQGGSRQVVAK